MDVLSSLELIDQLRKRRLPAGWKNKRPKILLHFDRLPRLAEKKASQQLFISRLERVKSIADGAKVE